MSRDLHRHHKLGRLRLSGGVGYGPVRRAWLLCGLVSLIVAACGHQDLVAIKPAGTGGAPSCAGNHCSYADPNHFAQCCDGTRCDGTTCVPWDAGYCPMFQTCTNDSSCCGGSSCETVAQSAKLCIGFTCHRLNAACEMDADCCSLACLNRTCSDSQPCTIQGKPCGANTDCCSGICGSNYTCYDATGTCAVIGDSCKTSDDCCSKTCVDVGNGSRCLWGGSNICGGLAPAGEICSQSTQCCFGTCKSGKCERKCANEGGFCSSPEECCSGSCLPSAGGSGQRMCGCSDPGSICVVPDNCCSHKCQYDNVSDTSICAPN